MAKNYTLYFYVNGEIIESKENVKIYPMKGDYVTLFSKRYRVASREFEFHGDAINVYLIEI